MVSAMFAHYRHSSVCVLVAIAAAFSSGYAQSESFFVYARDFDRPIEVTYPEYYVWAWAKASENATITVGGSSFEVPSQETTDTAGYAWSRLGMVSVESPVKIETSPHVAALAFTTRAPFRPDRVMSAISVFDQPNAVDDARAARAARVRDTDTVFTMPKFETRDEWETFAEKLRRRILLSCGLIPMPEKTPLNSHVFDRITRDEYTIEKVRFEAHPGFFVTGNLFRPRTEGPHPAVLCPHGHWENGRLEDSDRASVPGRAITLAKMGAVVLTVDMLGYNDSCQVGHRWDDRRRKVWGIHPFALQLWSSIRAIDFLQSLPGVDPERIACTGASGGGTQTFALMAVDPRVKVAAPVNMISSTMQGGCVCENAPLIRLANSNMEIGALMAPRPMLLVSATGDWTRETPRVEYPAIRSIYALYGATNRVKNVHIDAPHNYNRASREAMYRFFGQWLFEQPERFAGFEEPPFTAPDPNDVRVFPDGKPPHEAPTEAAIVASVIAAGRDKWQAELPDSSEELAAFQRKYATLLQEVTGAYYPDANELRPERVVIDRRNDHVREKWIIRHPQSGAAVPALFFRATAPGPQQAVVVVHSRGKAALIDLDTGNADRLITGLLASGKAVLAIDTFRTGDHHSPFAFASRVQSGSFSDTFLPTFTGYRIQDILTAIAFLDSRRDIHDAVDLVGLEDAGMWSLFAAAIAPNVRRALVDTNRHDFDEDATWDDHFYIPAIRSVGDISTAAALLAPRRLRLFDTFGQSYDTIRSIYDVIDPTALTVSSETLQPAEIVDALQ